MYERLRQVVASNNRKMCGACWWIVHTNLHNINPIGWMSYSTGNIFFSLDHLGMGNTRDGIVTKARSEPPRASSGFYAPWNRDREKMSQYYTIDHRQHAPLYVHRAINWPYWTQLQSSTVAVIVVLVGTHYAHRVCIVFSVCTMCAS